MRWSLIGLIAAVLLAVALARTRSAGTPPATDLIPLTRPELLALLRAAVLRTPRRDLAHTLHWSRWRRRHQYRAATCHRRWNKITAARHRPCRSPRNCWIRSLDLWRTR
jgi:hypothetical protein